MFDRRRARQNTTYLDSEWRSVFDNPRFSFALEIRIKLIQLSFKKLISFIQEPNWMGNMKGILDGFPVYSEIVTRMNWPEGNIQQYSLQLHTITCITELDQLIVYLSMNVTRCYSFYITLSLKSLHKTFHYFYVRTNKGTMTEFLYNI